MSRKCSQLSRAWTGGILVPLILSACFCFGQQLTGTLSGTVTDASGAAIPGASVEMRNVASGDTRTTVSNSSGYFSITAVQPGTYDVTVTAHSFKSWKQTGIHFAQGDNRTLSNIGLQVGQVTEVVEVSTEAGATVPVDTAEVSTTLNTAMINDAPLYGRNAGELLKLVPGVASTNGINQGSSFNPKVIGTNTGPEGSIAINGNQPYGTMAYMLDGGNLVDPGNMGTQIANINPDHIQEVKVLTSSYTAEYAKGPIVFQAYSKSGGTNYHGEGYLYTRNSIFNSWDAYNKSQFVSDLKDPANQSADRQTFLNSTLHPDEKYYYMGGNFGGPVRLPFTDFNKNHDKLFFWGGYEYMYQHPAGQILNYNVPTPAQLSGDFSNTGVPAGAISAWQPAYQTPSTNLPANATGTNIPVSDFDPNILGILKLYPKPNITPAASNGWNNYQFVNTVPQNRWEATGKVDYAISDNSKLSVSYSRQDETDQHPTAIWWNPAWTLPYPSPVVAATTAQDLLTNFTHVFSPTTTNEFVFTFVRYINPNVLGNPSAVDRSKLGFNVQGLFGHTTAQMPDFRGPWGGSMPDFRSFSFDGSFNGGGSFGGLKRDPALYDNFTKVIKNHTIKTGFYWDMSQNIQSSSNQDNGIYNYSPWGGDTTGNVIADLELGRPNNYQQSSAVPTDTIQFHQWSLYAQDSYKMTRRLTVNYGLRFNHLGQWYGVPTGIQVWDQASYVNTASAPANTGLLWHSKNSNIPESGWGSKLFYYEPRVGLAFDVFGTGKTVLRTGFASFHYPVSIQVCNNNACDGPSGAYTYSTTAALSSYAGIAQFNPPSTQSESGIGATIAALQQGDTRQPRTVDWNFTLSQQMPWRSLFEISYVGNRSTNEIIDGGNGKIYDLNNVPIGGFFKPDPKTGQVVSPSSSSFNSADYRPLVNYGDVYLITHGSYANYNALQTGWQKQSGPVSFLVNYTFSKTLGIRDGQTDNGAGNGTAVDPFNLRNNYGPLQYDHTHIWNFYGNWNLPSPIHGNKLLEGVINGWQFSNFTTFQSGAPLQASVVSLNATYPNIAVTLPNGLTATGMNASNWFGTNAIQNLLPVITCDPRSGLHSGQFFNPNCFAPPPYGQQGNLNWPYVKGPGYFDSDLGLYKKFAVTEHQNVQFRVTAINWLNHPLPQFGLAGNSDETLNFSGPNGTLSQTNTNATTTGKPGFKTGQRTIEFAMKYYF